MTARTRRNVQAGLVLALSGLIAGIVISVGWPSRAEPVRGGPAEGEVVQAHAAGLASNASAAEQRRITRLLRGARQAGDPAALKVDYPLDGSIFPGEMLAPTFLWHDAANSDRWLVEITFDGSKARLELLIEGGQPPEGQIDPLAMSGANEVYQPTEYQASATAWKPSPEVWEAIQANSIDREATFAFHGYREDRPEQPLSRGSVTLSTSSDPVDGSIFYRDVPLSPAKTSEGVIAPLP